MLTYGYIREATQAHMDLDEQEIQAMNLHARYHIFANEAMMAICAVKPKYEYFKITITETMLNTPIKMPEDFIAFANKQAWAFVVSNAYDPKVFIGGDQDLVPQEHSGTSRIRATKEMFVYAGSNTLIFGKVGEYWIPYKGTWFRFKSGIGDEDVIDMPIDILLTIPLYIASVCLQIDHTQKAAAKRAEFELALSRVTNPDFMQPKQITPTYR